MDKCSILRLLLAADTAELCQGLFSGMPKIAGYDNIPKLKPIAERLGCSMAQLALAWVVRNPSVSTVLLGATKIEQVRLTQSSDRSCLSRHVPGAELQLSADAGVNRTGCESILGRW